MRNISPTAYDVQSLAHYRAAIEKGVLPTTNHNIVLLGIAGGGKTHTMYLLLERNPPKERSSTPCAERPVQTTHGKQDEGRWVEVRPEGQVQMVAKMAKALPGPTKHACSLKPGPTPQPSSIQPQSTTLPLPVSLQSSTKNELGLVSRNEHFQRQVVYEMQRCHTAAPVEEVHFINLIDSGGQQQFHEVLPDFLPGIDALLLVHNASQPLDHYPEVELYEKNKRVGSCRSPLTNRQIIQRCLQTVQAQLVRGQCPVIVFVGTHGDLEQSWPEAREVKNAKLMELLTPEIAKRVIFFGQSLNEPLCVVNAKTPGPKDKKLAIDLRKEIEKLSPAMSHLIPLQWLGLVQALHGLAKDLGRGVLSKEECLDVALTLQFTLESLEDALRYLGELKQLHYYTFLPNVVFADSQVLLDKISELVRFHYILRGSCSQETISSRRRGFRQVPGRVFRRKREEERRPTAEATEPVILSDGRLIKFRDQGIISLDLLTEDQFSAHYIPDLFGPEQLLLVLEKLLLVAKVSDEDYLMPCLLPHTEGERIAQSPSSSVSPLLVHFPGGPRLGVFCHLLAYLLKEAKWELVYEDRKPMLVNRNSVAFALPDLACQVTLSDPFLSHFHVSVSSDFSEEFPSACPQIRATILGGIVQVCANLGYSDCVPVDAFSCSAEGSCRRSSPHPATVMPGSSRKFLSCTINKGTQTRMSKQELVWFPTAVNSAPSRGKQAE